MVKQAKIHKIDVLIIGAGMYVCGKGAESYGTILPSVLQACRQGLVEKIRIAATQEQSAREAIQKAAELAKRFGVNPHMEAYPQQGANDHAYRLAGDEMKGNGCTIISVPDHLHFEIAKEMIERRLHVLVVKPLVPKLSEARELIRLKNQNHVYGAVEYHKRWDFSNRKLLQIIREKRMGEISHIRINYSQRKSIPTKAFRSWVEHTDVFQYLGVHYVDLIHFLTNATPVRVISHGTKSWLLENGIDNYDTIQTLIEWDMPDQENNFLSSHFTSWIDPENTSAMSDQRVEVVGTLGRFHNDQKNRGVSMVTDSLPVDEINPYFSQSYPSVDGLSLEAAGYGPQSIVQFIQDAVDLAGGRCKQFDLMGLRPTFESSIPVTAVLEASRKSLQQGGEWVNAGYSAKEVSG